MDKSINLLVFDIDGTLCDINQPVSQGLAAELRRLAKQHTIVLASGKPFGYIAGFCRQLGIPGAVIIAENGAVIGFDANFPPLDVWCAPCDPLAVDYLAKVKQEFQLKFRGRIWFQPNDVALTVFPLDLGLLPQIHAESAKYEHDLIAIFKHADSVDMVPKGFHKGIALLELMARKGFTVEQIWAFGDGSNDLPLFEVAGSVVIVGDMDYRGDKEIVRVPTIFDLKVFLEKM